MISYTECTQLTTLQVHTEHRVYKIQKIGLLYLKEPIKFNIAQCERHLQLAGCQNGTGFHAMCFIVSQKQLHCRLVHEVQTHEQVFDGRPGPL
jgi:hypothetical protein